MKSFKKQNIQADKAHSCPACGSLVTEVSYVFENEEGRSEFFHCRTCGFLFARPVLISELDDRHMDGVENAELFNSRILKRIYVNYFIKKEIRELLRAKGVGNYRLLDIGCGTGWTTKVYADQGFEVMGLEPSRVRANYAREHHGIEVLCDYIENVNLANEFDVVVLRHIIEHFSEPRSVLHKIRGFLKKDGVVLVVVPNINCLGRYLFDTKWDWVLPWHCNFFTPASSLKLLQSEGFEILASYQTPSPLYFPGALLRTFPNTFVKWIMGRNRVISMALCAPLAVTGKWLGMGDNLNLIAKVE